MKTVMRTTILMIGTVVTIGCYPYEHRSGEYLAGTVDPIKFPTAYLGTGGTPQKSGGKFAPVKAWVAGTATYYYLFPMPAAQAAADDPLAVDSAPLAYVFDPRSDDPFPQTPACVPPADYVYDQRRDAIRYDEEGDILTLLPSSAGYLPVVAEVPVASAGEPCQDIKSEKTLVTRNDVSLPITPPDSPVGDPHGTPDGKYLAWAIFDPGADVVRPDGTTDPTGLTPQRWGFYQHYLAPFFDGGYLPTKAVTVPGTMGAPDAQVTEAVPQKLYYPTLVPGGAGMPPKKGAFGKGFDVLEAARGQAGYSPLCQVFSFKPADPNALPTDPAAIDQATVMDTGTYVYCLQLEGGR
jgi:hypothetical protein